MGSSGGTFLFSLINLLSVLIRRSVKRCEIEREYLKHLENMRRRELGVGGGESRKKAKAGRAAQSAYNGNEVDNDDDDEEEDESESESESSGYTEDNSASQRRRKPGSAPGIQPLQIDFYSERSESIGKISRNSGTMEKRPRKKSKRVTSH